MKYSLMKKRQWEDIDENSDLKWANIDLVNHTMMRWVDDGHLTLILLLFHHHPHHRSLFLYAYIHISIQQTNMPRTSLLEVIEQAVQVSFVWLIFVRLWPILTIILRFLHFFFFVSFFLINLPNRHRFIEKENVRVFTVFIEFFKNRLQYVRW